MSGRTLARDLRINEMIRIREVRVIDDEGQQLGVIPTSQALSLAQEKGLDLVEVAPTAVPPVCRILDYGDRVKVTVQFRGREMTHANLGRDLLDRAAGLLVEHGTIERPPLLEGRSMYIVMAPIEKRAEKKSDRGEDGATAAASGETGGGGETIGAAVAAKGRKVPTPAPEPAEPSAPTDNASMES